MQCVLSINGGSTSISVMVFGIACMEFTGFVLSTDANLVGGSLVAKDFFLQGVNALFLLLFLGCHKKSTLVCCS